MPLLRAIVRAIIDTTGVLVVLLLLLLFGPRPTTRGDDAHALFQMRMLQDALDMYRLSAHRYPTLDEGLSALEQGIMPRVPDDPWGHPYVYRPGESPTLRSLGEDGIEGTADDLRPGDSGRRIWEWGMQLH